MIRLDVMTRGLWGNKILQYNSAIQLAHKLQTSMSSVEWEGHQFFEGLADFKSPTRNICNIGWQELLDPDWDRLKTIHRESDLSLADPRGMDYCLHNVFFEVATTNPRKFFKIKPSCKAALDQKLMHVGIHFRGAADARKGRMLHQLQTHPKDYYINSIKAVLDCYKSDELFFWLCTDDTAFEVYQSIKTFLQQAHISYAEGGKPIGIKMTELVRTGANTLGTWSSHRFNHFRDFSTLAECDILISSASTYAVCAALVGKDDKKIIHSKAWLDLNVRGENYIEYYSALPDFPEAFFQSFDDFWAEIYRGNARFYSLWLAV